MQCSAKSKRSGQQCRNHAVKGRKTCRMHGGTSKVGPLAPAFKTGRYSKFLPQRFAQLIEAVTQTDVLDLTDDIKVLSARIADVLSRVDSGESGSLWKQARKLFDQFNVAQEAGDADKIVDALKRLDEVLAKGAADHEAWREVGELFSQRVKMVESQRKKALEAHTMMSTDEVLGMMRFLIESVKKHVRDPEALANISTDFARFSGESHLKLASARGH